MLPPARPTTVPHTAKVATMLAVNSARTAPGMSAALTASRAFELREEASGSPHGVTIIVAPDMADKRLLGVFI